MDQSVLDRINELAKIAKERELTPEEIEERRVLREQYIASYRASLRGILDNTVIIRPDGTKEKLGDKKNGKK